MKENLKDILANLHPDVDQQALLKYLEGRLSAAEQHEVEKKALADDFDADALEGLEGFSEKARLAAVVEALNKDLKRKTAKKEKRVHRRTANLPPWLLIAVVLILLLVILGYFLIHTMQNR